MNDNSILAKLEGLTEKYQQISEQISDPGVMADMKRYIALSKEYKELEPIVAACAKYKKMLHNLSSAKEILATEKDEELREMAKMEIDS
jgi:peptide chain release factor 1